MSRNGGSGAVIIPDWRAAGNVACNYYLLKQLPDLYIGSFFHEPWVLFGTVLQADCSNKNRQISPILLDQTIADPEDRSKTHSLLKVEHTTARCYYFSILRISLWDLIMGRKYMQKNHLLFFYIPFWCWLSDVLPHSIQPVRTSSGPFQPHLHQSSWKTASDIEKDPSSSFASWWSNAVFGLYELCNCDNISLGSIDSNIQPVKANELKTHLPASLI
jgi:hypothetical protein